ncbi:MAG: recombinase family protein [Rhizobiaceae bacterium]|nr:recombinase family protein [Rhizobiaceae bacterium]
MSRKGEETQSAQKAIIYCRVSTKKQASDGGGLESQEHRCRDYAADKGYVVEAVFPDDVSGGGDFINRPGMVALLAYLDAKPDENYVVIFDDLKRYARDTEFHLKLRRIMNERGATRECLNFNFENSPEGKFIETMLAAQGELEREQNGRQVIQKMRARIEQGFWVFQAPIGYKYQKSKYGGKELVRDEPAASVIQEALEGFASGRFQTQAEVKRFLENQPLYPKGRDGRVHPSRVTELLERVVYAGFIDAPKWGIAMREGRHEGLISYEVYHKNQARLKEGSLAPARKDINEDFVLRGFVECADCTRPLTACWSKGRNAHHPYYRCYYKDCESYGKSIPRAKIENQFGTVLQSLQPKAIFSDLIKHMFKQAWTIRSAQAKECAQAYKAEISRLDTQVEHLLNRIMETDNTRVIEAYEAKVAKLERDKIILREKVSNQGQPKGSYEDLFEPALTFLLNPWKLWVSGNMVLQKLVLRLAFQGRIQYDRKTGSLNTKKSFVFNAIEEVFMNKSKMVGAEGLEPPTRPL